jgi:hypothetical protein
MEIRRAIDLPELPACSLLNVRRQFAAGLADVDFLSFLIRK